MTVRRGVQVRLPAERHERILAALRREGAIRLSDMAKHLGVNTVTIRRDLKLLADRGLVTRVHGGATMPRLGEPAATGEHRGARPVVGMVAPASGRYWPDVVRGAQEYLARENYRLALRWSAAEAGANRRQIVQHVEHGAEALILAPVTRGRAGADLVRWLGRLPQPVVLIERVAPPALSVTAVDAVTTDHTNGAGIAIRHLAALGHHRIGLAAAHSSPTTPALRSGWSRALLTLDLDHRKVPDVDLVDDGGPGWEQVFDEFIDQCVANAVTAVILHSDQETTGLIRRVLDKGLRIPDDLAVVSYDNDDGPAPELRLTTVAPNTHLMGSVAAELALRRLRSPHDRPVHRVSLWPQLAVRTSCGGHGARHIPSYGG